MKAPIQVQYAFALNRRNDIGDRDCALHVLEKVIFIFVSLHFIIGMCEKLSFFILFINLTIVFLSLFLQVTVKKSHGR